MVGLIVVGIIVVATLTTLITLKKKNLEDILNYEGEYKKFYVLEEGKAIVCYSAHINNKFLYLSVSCDKNITNYLINLESTEDETNCYITKTPIWYRLIDNEVHIIFKLTETYIIFTK